MKETVWFFNELDCDGLPLLLRYPEAFDLNYYKEQFSELLLITYPLEHINALGLPHPEYNNSLKGLDEVLSGMFEEHSLGKTVFIETYAGRRIYYIYISEQADLGAYDNSIKEHFPGIALKWDLKEDPNWSFFIQFAGQYNLY